MTCKQCEEKDAVIARLKGLLQMTVEYDEICGYHYSEEHQLEDNCHCARDQDKLISDFRELREKALKEVGKGAEGGGQ